MRNVEVPNAGETTIFCPSIKLFVAVAGLVLWAAASIAIAALMHRGVIQEPVHFMLPDGTTIRGTLCRPRTDEIDLPIAVLLHGTSTGRQMCLPGLALPLARHGYLALAIDLCGHGESGGQVPRDELNSLTANPCVRGQHLEVDVAIDYLKKHPRYIKQHPCRDFHCIGLVGHSRGGWLAMEAGCRRSDVDSVITVGSAPLICDTSQPRNLLFLTGAYERLCPLPTCLMALRKSTGGAVGQPEVAFGDFWQGNARRLMCVNSADHLTEMAHPAVTTRVVEWLDSSLHIAPSDRRANDVGYLLGVCLIATTSGLAACAALGGLWPRSLLTDNLAEGNGGRIWRLAMFAVLLIALLLVAPGLSQCVEIGPVYACGPVIVLFSGMAGCACAAAWTTPEASPSCLMLSDEIRHGVVLGLVAALFGAVWLGVPWGMTWLQLLPTPRRLLLALVLFPTLLPASLVLARALQRLVGTKRYLLSPFAWFTVAALLWLGNHFLIEPRHPLYTVPIHLTVASFVLPWPLWMMRARVGLTWARGTSHAAALAWLLACHLPFIRSG